MEKAREFNVPLYLAFVDFKKAFDSVRHTILWDVMKKMGVSETIIGLLRKLYTDQQAAMKVDGVLTEWFDINKEVRQGCLVSPLCFNLYSEEVMRRSAEELQTVGVKINGRFLNNLRYADDILLVSTTPEGLQRLVAKLDQAASVFQLEISTKKTKIMAATRNEERISITCRGENLQQVEKFKYLGSFIDRAAGCSQEIRARLGIARSALKSLNSLWKDRAMNKHFKLKLMKTLVWPIALYGCESWTIKAEDLQRLHSFEMECYRRALRISWRMHRTNESVLQEMGTQRILVDTIKKRKLQYFGHVIRAQNLCTHIFEGRIDGGRSRGRQRKRWSDDIKEWTGRTLAQCTQLARDRSKWRRLVQGFGVPDPQP